MIARVLAFVAFVATLSAQISVLESVLTHHNSVGRAGVYDHETQLTPANVLLGQQSPKRFERLCIRKVDGQIAAQPLYVKGVQINGVAKNVLYVVTRSNRIYAFDADNVNSADARQGLVWANPIALKYTIPGTTRSLSAAPLKGMDDGGNCSQLHGPVGINSTPVIDASTQIMYLVARFAPQPQEPDYGTRAYYFLISLDIRTGQKLRRMQIGTAEALGANSCPPTGFNACAELNRPALLLLNGAVYVAFGAAVCDNKGSHGWVFAYSVPGMKRLDAYNTTPQSWGAGIWQSGAGLAADAARGFVYAFTGNNGDYKFIVDHQTGKTPYRDDLYHPSRTELGGSLLQMKLGANGKFLSDRAYSASCVITHFRAGNRYRLDTGFHSPFERELPGVSEGRRGDSDLGSGGPVVLRNGWVVGGGKQGVLYVSDAIAIKQARQGFQAFFKTWHSGPRTTCTANPVLQRGCAVAVNDYDLGQDYGPNIHGNPTVWERASAGFGYLYAMPEKDYLRAFRVLPSGRIVEVAEMSTDPAHHAPFASLPRGFTNGLRSPDGMPGSTTSPSSNGDSAGILWMSVSPNDATNSIEPGVLLAFDALNLNLWYDDDPAIYLAKFVPPTIAGGKVFRVTFGDNDPGCFWIGHKGKSCGSIVIYGLR